MEASPNGHSEPPADHLDGSAGKAAAQRTHADTPFDLPAALERCMGQQDFLERILKIFKDKAAKDLLALEEHVRAADAQKIAFVAHGLKGAAANLSAEALRQAACDLEQAGKAADFARVEACLERVRREVHRCATFVLKAPV